MPVSPTNLFMNWSSVVITPAGGSAITIAQVLDVEIDGKSVQKSFYGDARMFPLMIRNTGKTRSIKIVGGNPKIMATVPEDTACTIVAKLDDATNGQAVGGGGIVITAVFAKRASLPFSGKNNEFAGGTMTFNCASDPVTDADPITIAAA